MYMKVGVGGGIGMDGRGVAVVVVNDDVVSQVCLLADGSTRLEPIRKAQGIRPIDQHLSQSAGYSTHFEMFIVIVHYTKEEVLNKK